jgi:hypothetical protein
VISFQIFEASQLAMPCGLCAASRDGAYAMALSTRDRHRRAYKSAHGHHLAFGAVPLWISPMSAFDDIADEDLRASHATATFPRQLAHDHNRDIQDKCDELLRLAHDLYLEVKPSPHYVALLQDIWASAQGRQRLLSLSLVDAERLVDLAQRVRSRPSRVKTHSSRSRRS